MGIGNNNKSASCLRLLFRWSNDCTSIYPQIQHKCYDYKSHVCRNWTSSDSL